MDCYAKVVSNGIRLVRRVTIGCAIAAALAIGESHAQDFQYTITNGSITITNYIGSGGNVAIPATIEGLPVTAIGGQAFWAASTLTAVTIPDTVTNIQDGILTKGGAVGAFTCPALTNVTFGNGLLYIGAGTFAECDKLTQITIPDSVITLGDFAFHYAGLTHVKLGTNGTQLGPGNGYAFDGCNLTSITIPGSVTNLGAYAFTDCSSLASVVIEDGLTHIGFNAFPGCDSLTNITLPATVATIEDRAFAACVNLAGVYFKGNAPAIKPPAWPWADGVFYYSSNVTVYYLPGTSGWGPTYAGRPTVLWNPQVQTEDGSFGVRQNQFGFNIAGTADIPLVVEATVDLAATSWKPLQTCTLTNGLLYFSDPQWKNYPERLYRIRSP
ncbi:MAG TPA: leucine-rich repeat protein [Candidatus Limnocylindrales bacterium]|nr:leucine-rich repeat protein [Candidatus Limnocylindrales bacterium]